MSAALFVVVSSKRKLSSFLLRDNDLNMQMKVESLAARPVIDTLREQQSSQLIITALKEDRGKLNYVRRALRQMRLAYDSTIY